MISFNPIAIVYPIIHINDYSDKEILEAWYTKAELNTIKLDIRTTLLQIMSKKFDDANNNDDDDGDGDYCTRGLETHTPAGRAFKRKLRNQSIQKVLKEQQQQQQQQQDVQITTPELLLANVYSKETLFSRTTARIMGLADEETARRNQMKTTLMIRPTTTPSDSKTSMESLLSSRPGIMVGSNISANEVSSRAA